MIILGVDPGTIKTGYGLIFKDGGRVKALDCGIIKMNS
ncbi:MAG: crossover junction endodeoxyribonuclease RuvC, partial [Candidatus Omnitrophica bacterium]|nr:crossover junction endodeoxyribonuclease RuvC [Candidatus Omnitrophota bacterium]